MKVKELIVGLSQIENQDTKVYLMLPGLDLTHLIEKITISRNSVFLTYLHPNKRRREDCAECLYPDRHCSKCINKK